MLLADGGPIVVALSASSTIVASASATRLTNSPVTGSRFSKVDFPVATNRPSMKLLRDEATASVFVAVSAIFSTLVGIPGRRIAAWSVRDRDLFAARGSLQSLGRRVCSAAFHAVKS